MSQGIVVVDDRSLYVVKGNNLNGIRQNPLWQVIAWSYVVAFEEQRYDHQVEFAAVLKQTALEILTGSRVREHRVLKRDKHDSSLLHADDVAKKKLDDGCLELDGGVVSQLVYLLLGNVGRVETEHRSCFLYVSKTLNIT